MGLCSKEERRNKGGRTKEERRKVDFLDISYDGTLQSKYIREGLLIIQELIHIFARNK